MSISYPHFEMDKMIRRGNVVLLYITCQTRCSKSLSHTSFQTHCFGLHQTQIMSSFSSEKIQILWVCDHSFYDYMFLFMNIY